MEPLDKQIKDIQSALGDIGCKVMYGKTCKEVVDDIIKNAFNKTSNEIEIKLCYTPEELSILLDGLNNAYIALKDIYTAGKLGCQVPNKFRPFFETRTDSEIMRDTCSREKAIKQLYDFLLSYEQK